MMRAWSLVLAALVISGCRDSVRQAACPRDAPTKSEFTQSYSTQHFEVEGASPRAIAESIHARMPCSELGESVACTSTQLCPSWSFTWRDGEPCRLAALHVALNIVFVMPKWSQPAKASAKTVAWWNEFLPFAQTHEQGHAQISLEGAQAAYEAGLAITEAATCEELTTKITQAMQARWEATMAKQHEYDAKSPKALIPNDG